MFNWPYPPLYDSLSILCLLIHRWKITSRWDIHCHLDVTFIFIKKSLHARISPVHIENPGMPELFSKYIQEHQQWHAWKCGNFLISKHDCNINSKTQILVLDCVWDDSFFVGRIIGFWAENLRWDIKILFELRI